MLDHAICYSTYYYIQNSSIVTTYSSLHSLNHVYDLIVLGIDRTVCMATRSIDRALTV